MELDRANRRWAELHEERPFHDGTFTHWADKPDRAHPFHFNDGVRILVVTGEDPSPEDEFLEVESAGLPAAQQPVGDESEAPEGTDDEG